MAINGVEEDRLKNEEAAPAVDEILGVQTPELSTEEIQPEEDATVLYNQEGLYGETDNTVDATQALAEEVTIQVTSTPNDEDEPQIDDLSGEPTNNGTTSPAAEESPWIAIFKNAAGTGEVEILASRLAQDSMSDAPSVLTSQNTNDEESEGAKQRKDRLRQAIVINSLLSNMSNTQLIDHIIDLDRSIADVKDVISALNKRKDEIEVRRTEIAAEVEKLDTETAAAETRIETLRPQQEELLKAVTDGEAVSAADPEEMTEFVQNRRRMAEDSGALRDIVRDRMAHREHLVEVTSEFEGRLSQLENVTDTILAANGIDHQGQGDIVLGTDGQYYYETGIEGQDAVALHVSDAEAAQYQSARLNYNESEARFIATINQERDSIAQRIINRRNQIEERQDELAGIDASTRDQLREVTASIVADEGIIAVNNLVKQGLINEDGTLVAELSQIQEQLQVSEEELASLIQQRQEAVLEAESRGLDVDTMVSNRLAENNELKGNLTNTLEDTAQKLARAEKHLERMDSKYEQMAEGKEKFYNTLGAETDENGIIVSIDSDKISDIVSRYSSSDIFSGTFGSALTATAATIFNPVSAAAKLTTAASSIGSTIGNAYDEISNFLGFGSDEAIASVGNTDLNNITNADLTGINTASASTLAAELDGQGGAGYLTDQHSMALAATEPLQAPAVPDLTTDTPAYEENKTTYTTGALTA